MHNLRSHCTNNYDVYTDNIHRHHVDSVPVVEGKRHLNNDAFTTQTPQNPENPENARGEELHALLWRYAVPKVDDQQGRDEVFLRMQEQDLLPLAMCAVSAPTLDQWRALTRPDKAWLLRCETLEPHPVLLGAALLTPWRHRVWEFDFTVFRPYFGVGPLMARGALRWVWKHAPCDSLMGLCPATHRHAWKLAEAGGFEVLGRLPGACLLASRAKGKRTVDGVLVLARRQ